MNFFNKNSQTHDFFNTFCQLWLLCCIAMMECLQKNSSVTSVETKVFGYDFLLLHGWTCGWYFWILCKILAVNYITVFVGMKASKKVCLRDVWPETMKIAFLHPNFQLMVNIFLIFTLNSTFFFFEIDFIFIVIQISDPVTLTSTFVVCFGISFLK